MFRILLWCYFVNRLTVSLQNLTSVFASDTFLENWSMSPYWNKTDGEKIMFWMIIGGYANYTCCLKDQWRIDINWKFNVSLFVSVKFKFSFLFCRLIKSFMFFLFILNFFFHNFVNLAKPLHSGQYFWLWKFTLRIIYNTIFIDMIQNILIVNFVFNISWMIFW